LVADPDYSIFIYLINRVEEVLPAFLTKAVEPAKLPLGGLLILFDILAINRVLKAVENKNYFEVKK
jgi:hypothetical protein